MVPALSRRDAIGLGIIFLLAAVSVVVYPGLPDRMAIHFDDTGQPDSFLAKPLAVAFGPLVGVVTLLLFRLLPRVDPLGGNVAAFQRYYDIAALVTVATLAYVQALVLAYNLGYRFDLLIALVPALAAVYVTLGYLVENAEQNWFVGINTPWTLSDETVWKETHRRTGDLFKLAGLATLLAIPFPDRFLLVAVGPAVAAALFGTVYSYVLYRRRRRERAG